MEISKIITTAIKINEVTNLNTYVIDQNETFIYNRENISIPKFMPGSSHADIIDLKKKMSKRMSVYSYINEWELHYLGYFFDVGKERYSVIIGPYLETTPDLFTLSINYKLNSKETDQLRAFTDEMHILTEEKANSYSSVLQQFRAMIDHNEKPTIVMCAEKNMDHENKHDNTSIVDEEAELVELRYKIERDFMHAVEQGNKTLASKLINSKNMLFSFSYRFPNQPLHRLKSLDVVLNTLLRIAARNSHVPAIMIHHISEKYAYKIEHASQLTILHQLQDQMIEEYSDIVLSHSLSNYSKMVQAVIELLITFYDKKINKDELASHFNTHQSHLSRRFKQETQMTITAYQQMIRIKKAKHLLENDSLSIEEIAWKVGYEDPSYFGRVFKKETGCTPSQYREGETNKIEEKLEGRDKTKRVALNAE